MGEYELTIEKLNKVLVEHGFSEVNHGVLCPGDYAWHSSPSIPIRFDKNGRYIKPENGKYD
jgi:hypothetical protein